MTIAVVSALLVAMVLTLARALRGPTVYDRVLAVNSFGTITVLLLCMVAFISERWDLVDIALIYMLLGFTGTLAVLRFSEGAAARGSETP